MRGRWEGVPSTSSLLAGAGRRVRAWVGCADCTSRGWRGTSIGLRGPEDLAYRATEWAAGRGAVCSQSRGSERCGMAVPIVPALASPSSWTSMPRRDPVPVGRTMRPGRGGRWSRRAFPVVHLEDPSPSVADVDGVSGVSVCGLVCRAPVRRWHRVRRGRRASWLRVGCVGPCPWRASTRDGGPPGGRRSAGGESGVLQRWTGCCAIAAA